MKSFSSYIISKHEDEIKNAIYNYVAGFTTAVNNHLRQDNYNIVKDYCGILDSAFDSRYGKKGLVDAYRVVDWEYLKNIYGITKHNIDNFINKTIRTKGYSSTTKNNRCVWGTLLKDNVMLHITSNKPVSMLDINTIFSHDEIDCADQEEILLPRDLKMKIIKYEIVNNTYNITLKIL